jgi:hypothetical protein
VSVEGVAERMSALLRERPQTFYELLRHLDDVEYRTILKSWGLLRERRALGRDAHGRYLIRTMGGLEGPPNGHGLTPAPQDEMR